MKMLVGVIGCLALVSTGFGALELPDAPQPARPAAPERPAVPPPVTAERPAASPPGPVARPAGRAVEAPAADELGLVCELKDGSRVVGRITPRTMAVAIRTEALGELKVPLERIRGIQFAATNSQTTVTLQNGDKLQGVLAQESFKLTTIFGKVSIPAALVARLTVAETRAVKAPEGLALWYAFDADEGARVTDQSGHDNHGRVQGAVWAPEGKLGGAMRFGVRLATVRVGNPEALGFQDFTIAAWIKRDSRTKVAPDNPGGVIFGHGRGGFIFLVDEEGRLLLSKNGLDFVRTGPLVQDTEYHHVVVTKDGTAVIFYVDGAGQPRQDYRTQFTFGLNAAVGAAPDDFNCSFLGLIDEVMIFNRALSADEIKSLYDSQK